MIGSPPGRAIAVARLPNLRDLGGWETPSGPVRDGLVYRSVELGEVDPGDPAIAALGLVTVFDLRTGPERDAHPDRTPPGVQDVHLDVLADASQAAPADFLHVFDDPAAATDALSGGRAEKIMIAAYREMVSLPSARSAYRTLFEQMADPSVRPCLFHCTTGKDRTGWASASLLTLLGVDPADVMAEYLLTNDQLLPSLQPVMDGFAAKGGDPALLLGVLGVEEQYLQAAMEEMTSRFGSIDNYFTAGLGLADSTVEALRAGLVARDGAGLGTSRSGH